MEQLRKEFEKETGIVIIDFGTIKNTDYIKRYVIWLEDKLT